MKKKVVLRSLLNVANYMDEKKMYREADSISIVLQRIAEDISDEEYAEEQDFLNHDLEEPDAEIMSCPECGDDVLLSKLENNMCEGCYNYYDIMGRHLGKSPIGDFEIQEPSKRNRNFIKKIDIEI